MYYNKLTQDGTVLALGPYFVGRNQGDHTVITHTQKKLYFVKHTLYKARKKKQHTAQTEAAWSHVDGKNLFSFWCLPGGWAAALYAQVCVQEWRRAPLADRPWPSA